MKWLKNQLVIFLSIITLVTVLLHGGVIFLLFKDIQTVVFNYLFWNYLFFFVFSVLFLISLTIIKKQHPDYFGYLILVFMTIKTVLCYLLFEFFLVDDALELETYKMNFLFLFVFYLGIDVYNALKLLNDSEQKS